MKNNNGSVKILYWLMGALLLVVTTLSMYIVNRFEAEMSQLSAQMDRNGNRITSLETEIKNLQRQIDYLLRKEP